MPRLAALLVLLLPLLLSSAVDAEEFTRGGVGFKATLRHVDANAGYTEAQLLSRAVRRSRARVATLQSLAVLAPRDAITAARILVRYSDGEYLMEMGIGTPTRYYSAILDTGSDLIWTQCAPCLLCVDQPTPMFAPANSTTYRVLGCTSSACNALYDPLCFNRVCVYQYFYGDSASTAGVLANETFTFGTNGTRVKLPKISFGCGNLNSGSIANGSGMVGFGRGPLSLVSQLGSPRFSYCLTSFLSPVPSRLYFGVYATLNRTNASTSTSTSGEPVRSTPFVVNPALPTMYFLNMTGISVGGELLDIDPAVFAINDTDGTGGTIIDSGTTITYLAEAAYDVVREAFESQITLPLMNVTETSVLDTCFEWPPPLNVSVILPQLVLHFDGADWELPLQNYMLADPGGTGGLCLAMGPSSDGSIIGSFQHQNFNVLYDLENSLLSFVPAPCNLM